MIDGDFQDDYGHTMRWRNGHCFLKVYGNSKGYIELGHLTGANRMIFLIYRDTAKHYMKKIHGFGFNDQLLKRFLIPHGYSVGLNLDNKFKYLLDPNDIVQLGQYLHFKTNGFEKQIFLSLSNIQQIAKWTNEVPQNGKLDL